MSGQHRRVEIPFPYRRGWCRWCGEEILNDDGSPNRRRAWHPACVDAYQIAAWPTATRSALLERDDGVCAACGADTRADQRAAEARYAEAMRTYGEAVKAWDAAGPPERSKASWFDWYQTRPKRPPRQRFASAWEADHIVPLIDGGSFGLDNLQTLCVPCHRAKTAAEATARAGKPRTPPPEQLRIA